MRNKVFRNWGVRLRGRRSGRVFFINHKVRDRLFRFIFEKDRKALLQLYNALNGTDYQDESALTIVTLQDVVYMSMKNDLAFIIAGVLNMYEHQSTFNPNMPVRFFIYLGQEFQKVIARKKGDLYGRSLIRLPNPRCVVFYNGDSEEPDERILRLSDAYEQKEEVPQVELTVRMININFGHNKELMEKCRRLWEYSYFVDQIKKRIQNGIGLNEAVTMAVDCCIDRDILADILEDNRMEVVGMLLTEFNERKYKRMIRKQAREEGLEEGRAEGRAAGRIEMLLTLSGLKGELSVQTKERILREEDPVRLQEYFRRAQEADSIKAFEEWMKSL